MSEEFGDTLMDIDDLAIYLKIAKQTIYNWLNNERIPGIKLGHVWRFKKEQVDSWLLTKVVNNENVSNTEFSVIGSGITFEKEFQNGDMLPETGHPFDEFSTKITSKEELSNDMITEESVDDKKESLEVEKSDTEVAVSDTSTEHALPKIEGYMGKT